MTSASPDEARQLIALVAALRESFTTNTASDHAIAAEIRRVDAELARADAPALPLQPTGHPLIRFLPDVLARAASTAPGIAAALGPIGRRLPWRYGYAPRADAPGLEHAMGWAELVGPAAPIVSHEIGFGLTLLGPDVHYFAHRHPAVELYRIVVGHPHWTVGDTTRRRSPGDAILHATNEVHAMRTEAEPLLAIYSWSGDIDSPSVWA